MPFVLEKILSGGQTGVDQAGLKVAAALGYRTGGTAPRDWKTDEGPAPLLLQGYGLFENRFYGYATRTRQNVRDADLTVWFGDPDSPGGKLTISFARTIGKPVLINPDAAILRKHLEHYPVKVLNVAGNRRRTNPAAMVQATAVLTEALAR